MHAYWISVAAHLAVSCMRALAIRKRVHDSATWQRRTNYNDFTHTTENNPNICSASQFSSLFSVLRRAINLVKTDLLEFYTRSRIPNGWYSSLHVLERIYRSKHRRTRRTSFIISNLFIRGKCECTVHTQLWPHLPCLQRTVCRVRNVSLDVLRFTQSATFSADGMHSSTKWNLFYRVGRDGRRTVCHSLTMTPSGTSQITIAPTQIVLVILLFFAIFCAILSFPAWPRSTAHKHSRGRIDLWRARAPLCVQSVGCGFNWICTVLFFSANVPTLSLGFQALA